MKRPQVKIYVYAMGKGIDRCWISRIEDKESTKEIYGKTNEPTANRALISAMIEAVSGLNKSKTISFYVPTQVGFKGSKTNKDLIDKLKKLLEDNNHKMEEHITKDFNNELRKILTSHYKPKTTTLDNIKSSVIKTESGRLVGTNQYKNLKYMSIYLKSGCLYKKDIRIGIWVAILSYKGHTKTLKGNVISDEVTDGQMTLLGANEAIKSLKEPCHIDLYTGFSITFKGTTNKEYKDNLRASIMDNNHVCNIVVTDRYKHDLNKICEDYYNELGYSKSNYKYYE